MHKKIVGWIAVAFLAFYVISNPTEAANLARSAGAGVFSFATALTGGDK